MLYLEDLFTTVITLKFYIIVLIGILYILIHHYRYHPVLAYLDILLNYIPVLTHEFGHILFNKISGGRAKDLVIVTRPYERQMTSQQGYAITQSTSRSCNNNIRWLYFASNYVTCWCCFGTF